MMRAADRQRVGDQGPGGKSDRDLVGKRCREKQSQNFGDKFKASQNLSHYVISPVTLRHFLPISSRPPPLPPPTILLLPFLFFFHAIAARLTQTTQITIKINTSAVGPNVSS